MDVLSVTPTAQVNASGSSSTRKTSLSQEDFMNLFVTQLKNQNPLEPMDNYQMASQMAQFSSLEALGNISQSLQNLTSYQASMNSLQATGLIGKKVEISGNRLFKEEGSISEGYYKLSQPGKVTINIYDANHQLIRAIEGGVKDTSKQKVTWDGKDQNGNVLPQGTYTFEVTAIDEKGQILKGESWMVGAITGVSFENGIAYMNMKSGKITLSDIVAILA